MWLDSSMSFVEFPPCSGEAMWDIPRPERGVFYFNFAGTTGVRRSGDQASSEIRVQSVTSLSTRMFNGEARRTIEGGGQILVAPGDSLDVQIHTDNIVLRALRVKTPANGTF